MSDLPGAAANPIEASDEGLRRELQALHDACQEAFQAHPTRFEFKLQHEGEHYRVTVLEALGGQVFVVRRFRGSLESIDKLGIPSLYVSELLRPGLQGLFVFAGAMKSGKTTSVCAMAIERLRLFGGVTVTVEDPIEYPIEGQHGPGTLFQTEVSDADGGYAAGLKRVLRYGAKSILVGELRDEMTVLEALYASLNGHLVLTTFHAEDAVKCVQRLAHMASHLVEADTVRNLLSDGLAGVLHQKLEGQDKQRRLVCELLMVQGSESAPLQIRTNRLELLKGEVNLQRGRLMEARAVSRMSEQR